ncbi:MAG TPA: DUF1592 domain-containing protein, partial [Steroidobacteraceae bacterium]|nr:DUF1592 domain-containing protein [Steroidobacteraceae bacterium]
EESDSPLRARLISGTQYSRTIANIFGEDISAAVASPLPPFTRTDGLLATGAASIGMTSDQLQQLQQAATTIATKAVDEDHREFLVPCKPASAKAADDACATEFIKSTGRLLYRRPLPPERLESLVRDAGTASNQLKDFYAGLSSVLEGMLVSPQMLFIVETPEPDPENSGRQRLDAYSLASRLSFFLWNSAPDDALLSAAESGEIQTRKGRERIVDTMLKSSRVEHGVRAFFEDLLAFDKFDTLAKDPTAYPDVTGSTLADAREQTLRTIVDHLITKKADYRDLFTTRDTFMSMNLAVTYGIPAVDGWVPYEFPEDSNRVGLLTHVSFLASHAHPARSSPTLRGKALRELLLCQKVPPPPPNVDFSSVEDPDASLKTARERLNVHSSNPSCAGCHLITDPMGLALENFDGAGHYRETEDGAALDTTGDLDGTEFKDVKGLSQALRDHPMLSACLVKRMYSFGVGGPVSMSTDRQILAYLRERFTEQGYKVPELLREIALSTAFSQVREPKPAKPTTTLVEAEPKPAHQIATNNH